MASPKLKITYFNWRGRAEPIRLACLLGDLEFIDDRFEASQLEEVKKATPYLAVPTMSIDGKIYAQSNALLRYVGKLSGMYPDSPLQALQVDEIIDTLGDFYHCCLRYKGPDKDILKEERRKLMENDVPRYIGGLEKRLVAFGNGPHTVGDEITIADLLLLNFILTFKSGFLEYVDMDVFDKYTRIMESYNAVMKEPKVVDWYKKYPVPNVSVPPMQEGEQTDQ